MNLNYYNTRNIHNHTVATQPISEPPLKMNTTIQMRLMNEVQKQP